MGLGDWIGSAYNGIQSGLGDYSLHGAHNWFVGGDASKRLNNTNVQGMEQAQQQLSGLSSAQAPTVQGYQLNADQMNQSRAGQMGVADRLGAVAGGQQAGAGEIAVNRQMGQAQANQIAMARSQRGANSAIAARNAARNSADMGLAGAGQAAQAQMSDQQAANAQLGQIYGSMYGQDAQVAAQNAQLNQQAALANQDAQLKSRALQIQALGEQRGWSQAQIDLELKRAGVEVADKGIVAGLFSGGGGMMSAASDERLKTDVADGGDDADELMRTLRPKRYRYLDEKKHGAGPRLGIMAQDLERSKLGKSAVVTIDREGHLGFDLGKGTSAALAAVARLDERLRKIEGKREGLGLGALAGKAA